MSYKIKIAVFFVLLSGLALPICANAAVNCVNMTTNDEGPPFYYISPGLKVSNSLAQISSARAVLPSIPPKDEAVMKELEDHIIAASNDGKYDEPNNHKLYNMPYYHVWELRKALDEAYQKFLKIEEENPNDPIAQKIVYGAEAFSVASKVAETYQSFSDDAWINHTTNKWNLDGDKWNILNGGSNQGIYASKVYLECLASQVNEQLKEKRTIRY